LRLIHSTGWKPADVEQAIAFGHTYDSDAHFMGRVVAYVRAATTPAEIESGHRMGGTRLSIDSATQLALDDLTTRYLQRHPDGSVRLVQLDPATLRAAADHRTNFMRHVRELTDLIWHAGLHVGAMARLADTPYTAILLQLGADIRPVNDPDPDAFAEEVDVVRRTLNHRVAIEPSALVTMTLLPGRWAHLIAQFSAVCFPRICIDDLLNSIDLIRRDTVHLDTPGNGEANQVDSRADAVDEARVIQTQIAAIQHAVERLEHVDIPDVTHATEILMRDISAANPNDGPLFDLASDGAWLAPLELATIQDLAVWSDDVALRRTIRTAGIPTFSTTALLHVLYTDHALEGADLDYTALLAGYVVDLPRQVQPIIDHARNAQWQPGAAATALARTAWWWAQGNRPEDVANAINDYIAIASAVHGAAPEHLPIWFFHAAQGFAGNSTGAAITQRVAILATMTLRQVVVSPTTAKVAELVASAFAAAILVHRRASVVTASLEQAPDQPSPTQVIAAISEQLTRWLTSSATEGGLGLTSPRAANILDPLLANLNQDQNQTS
jgi:hypothetical protein